MLRLYAGKGTVSDGLVFWLQRRLI
jgi:hypothetical protein